MTYVPGKNGATNEACMAIGGDYGFSYLTMRLQRLSQIIYTRRNNSLPIPLHCFLITISSTFDVIHLSINGIVIFPPLVEPQRFRRSGRGRGGEMLIVM